MTTTVEVIADTTKAAGTPFITGHPGGSHPRGQRSPAHAPPQPGQ